MSRKQYFIANFLSNSEQKNNLSQQCGKMTFITGPSFTTKSTPIIDSKAQELVVQMCPVHFPAGGGAGVGAARVLRRPSVPIVRDCVLFFMTLATIIAFGTLIHYMSTKESGRLSRYRGYCTIPIKSEGGESSLVSIRVPSDYNVMPLHWSQDDDADVQLFQSGAGEPAGEAEELVKTLHERFDIGDQVEKISVMDNGKRVNFIHDFEHNTTDIEDTDRCFTSELDRETVLTPSLLLLNIEDGAVFDLSRIRLALAAELPALMANDISPALREACMEKPVYRLFRQQLNGIRKRSVDGPAHDYIQFSGRGIQEIEISNLAEILQHEQDAAIAHH